MNLKANEKVRRQFFFTAIAAVFMWLGSSFAADRPTVIVKPLTGDTAQIQGWQPALGEGLAEMLVTRLTESGKFDVLESTALDDLIKEKGLDDAGFVEKGETGKRDSFAAADYMLVGKVTRFGSKSQGVNLGGFVPQSGGKLGVGMTTSDVQIDWRFTDVASRRVAKAGKATGAEKGASFDVGVAVDGHGGSIGFQNQEFMNSALGKATVKALDEVMKQISAVELKTSARRENIAAEKKQTAQIAKNEERQAEENQVVEQKQAAEAYGKVLAVVDGRTIIVALGSRHGLKVGSRLALFPADEIVGADGQVVWQDKAGEPVGELEIVAIQSDRCKTKYSGAQEIKPGWFARRK